MAANFSVEEVIEMVTADSDVDENEEFKESDTFEDVMRQKLDELGEYAVEIKADFNKDTFKTFTLRYGLACFDLCSTAYGNTMKRVLESNVNCGSILCSESRLWLEIVQRKLGGCLKIWRVQEKHSS